MNDSFDQQPLVVVVDDEPFVLNTLCSILARSGFRVLRAGSPEVALQLAAEEQSAIDLVLCDVIMPGMSGPDLTDRFLESHPEARCLFIAGFPDSPEVARRVLARGLAFLPKPFLPATLVAKVWEVLGGVSDRAMASSV